MSINPWIDELDQLLLFTCWAVSNSLRPLELQQARLPCPSLSPRVCSNSSPLIQRCHPTGSSSGAFFSSCPQFFPASGFFQMSQFFASHGQSIGTSASASVISMNTQDWFPLGLTGFISLLPKELSRVFNNTVWKHQFFGAQPSLWSNSWTTGKAIALTIWTFVSKLMSLLLNMLSTFVIPFLPRSKLCLLILWLQSPWESHFLGRGPQGERGLELSRRKKG